MNYRVFHDSFTGDIEHSGIFNLFPQENKSRDFGESKAAFKTGASKVPRPRPVLPSLLRPICQACVNGQLSSTPPSPPRGREKKNETKMKFSSCNDHSPKWIINDCYIFYPYLRVRVFLFLRTSFFKAQHVGPMLHKVNELSLSYYLPIARKRTIRFIPFPGGIIVMWNANRLVQELNSVAGSIFLRR